MNWQKYLLHGLLAGIFSSMAGIIYLRVYQTTLGSGFGKIITPGAIAGSCVFGCLLMAVGYLLLGKWQKESWKGGFNIIIAVLSFASLLGPIAMTLPLDTPSPELFPGLAIPMHFFPALAFFTLVPFFKPTS